MKKLTAFYAAFVGGVRFLIAQISSDTALVIGVFGFMVFLSTLLSMTHTYELNQDMSAAEVIIRYALATVMMVFAQARYKTARKEERLAAEKAKWVAEVLSKIKEGEVNA